MTNEQKDTRANGGRLELTKQLGDVGRALRNIALEATIAQNGLVLIESQLVALKEAEPKKEPHGDFNRERPATAVSRTRSTSAT